jgi:hypothetical protein
MMAIIISVFVWSSLRKQLRWNGTRRRRARLQQCSTPAAAEIDRVHPCSRRTRGPLQLHTVRSSPFTPASSLYPTQPSNTQPTPH